MERRRTLKEHLFRPDPASRKIASISLIILKYDMGLATSSNRWFALVEAKPAWMSGKAPGAGKTLHAEEF